MLSLPPWLPLLTLEMRPFVTVHTLAQATKSKVKQKSHQAGHKMTDPPCQDH
jgi:hypothetical protein